MIAHLDQKEANSDRNEQELADRHHNTFGSFQPFCNFHKLCSENPESPYHLDGKWKQPKFDTCYWRLFSCNLKLDKHLLYVLVQIIHRRLGLLTPPHFDYLTHFDELIKHV